MNYNTANAVLCSQLSIYCVSHNRHIKHRSQSSNKDSPMRTEEEDEEDSFEYSEVLITNLSLRWLRQHGSYANAESFGIISN